jgi:hypothetical protein
MFRVPRILFILLGAGLLPSAGLCSELPKEVLDKMDAAIAAAHRAASAQLPCKIGTDGKLHMLHWQSVDKCLSQASALVNWGTLAKQLEDLRPGNVTPGDFATAVENSLSKNALPYDRVFAVKDAKALLPLTNPVLKYLPPNSLHNQPVIDHNGDSIGTFAGVYIYERGGGTISGGTYRLSLFQYLDAQGKVQVPSDKQLRDPRGFPLFGVMWTYVSGQPGFRLNSEELVGIGKPR